MIRSQHDETQAIIASQPVESKKKMLLMYQYHTRLAFYFEFMDRRQNPEDQSKEHFLEAIARFVDEKSTISDWPYRKPLWSEFLNAIWPALSAQDFYTQVSFLTDSLYGLSIDTQAKEDFEAWLNRSGLLERDGLPRYEKKIETEASRWFKSAETIRRLNTQILTHRGQSAACIQVVEPIYSGVCEATTTLIDLKQKQSSLFLSSHQMEKALLALDRGVPLKEFISTEGMRQALLYERTLRDS